MAQPPRTHENLLCNLDRDVELSDRINNRVFAQQMQGGQMNVDAILSIRERSHIRYCPQEPLRTPFPRGGQPKN